MIFRVEECTDGRCTGCAANENKKLCGKMPDCYNLNPLTSLKFIKLNANEAKHAIKHKLTINQYPQ